MKVLVALISGICLIGCNSNSDGENSTKTGDSTVIDKPQQEKQDSSSGVVYNFTDNPLQKKITDTLMLLPFVRESNRHIDSISNHQKKISFITDTTGKSISVMAGYSGPERFETYHHFSIDPKTFEIKVMDETSGDYIPVNQYLKKNLTRQ